MATFRSLKPILTTLLPKALLSEKPLPRNVTDSLKERRVGYRRCI